ncbi:MAG: hypothetical protein DRI86_00580 [Bacteroidetes bacterium]|nr:MAG: hypothetical protein DRI86_00580 [Bacteroidota bacterium]
MQKILSIVFIILSVQFTATAQYSIGISLSGIGYHPKKEKYDNVNMYKWSIDKKGQFVAFSSITFFFSYRFNDYVGAKLMQSLVLSDCAGHFAGITHFGIDLHDDIIGIKNPNHQLSATFGPFWYYRKNWNENPNYKQDLDYLKSTQNNKWETRFVWHGGQIEYSYLIPESNTAITVNFLPAIPYLYTLGLGAKYLP